MLSTSKSTQRCIADATVLGAALLVGIGVGLRKHADDVLRQTHTDVETVLPNTERHHIHPWLYERAYLLLQPPLRQISHMLAQHRAQR